MFLHDVCASDIVLICSIAGPMSVAMYLPLFRLETFVMDYCESESLNKRDNIQIHIMLDEGVSIRIFSSSSPHHIQAIALEINYEERQSVGSQISFCVNLQSTQT